MNLLKKGEGVPVLNFAGDLGVPLLNFEGGTGVSILFFEGGLWSWVPGPRVPRSWVPRSWSQFYTILVLVSALFSSSLA